MIGDVKASKVLFFFLALSMPLLYSCSAPVSNQVEIPGEIPEENQEKLQESTSEKPTDSTIILASKLLSRDEAEAILGVKLETIEMDKEIPQEQYSAYMNPRTIL